MSDRPANPGLERLRITMEWQGETMVSDIRIVRTGDFDFDDNMLQVIGHAAQKAAYGLDRTRRSRALARENS